RQGDAVDLDVVDVPAVSGAETGARADAEADLHLVRVRGQRDVDLRDEPLIGVTRAHVAERLAALEDVVTAPARIERRVVVDRSELRDVLPAPAVGRELDDAAVDVGRAALRDAERVAVLEGERERRVLDGEL